MDVLFGLSQPQVCLWIKRLTPLVNQALGHELLLPARQTINRVIARVRAGVEHALAGVKRCRDPFLSPDAASAAIAVDPPLLRPGVDGGFRAPRQALDRAMDTQPPPRYGTHAGSSCPQSA